MGIPGAIAGGIQDYLNPKNIQADIMGGEYDRLPDIPQGAPLPRGPMPSPSGQLLPTGGSAGPGGFDDAAAGVAGQALLGGEAASASDMAADGPDGSGGIGLMGTLGILNMGMGLGGQIFKMVTSGRPKPQKRRMSVPTPGGNAFR